MKKGYFVAVMLMLSVFILAIGLTQAQAQPDLKVTSLKVQAFTAYGSKIFITDVTKNQGDAPTGVIDPDNPLDPTGATFTCYFLSSTNKVVDSSTDDVTDGILLGCRYVPKLKKGAQNTGSLYVTIPKFDVISSSYYIIARADYAPEFSKEKRRKKGYVIESKEGNNQLSKSILIYLSKNEPDLEISSLSAPSSASPGQDISIDDTTTNSGDADVLQTLTKFYLSLDSTLDNTDVPLGSRLVPSLSAGSGSSGTTNVTIPPETEPSIDPYYIIAVADSSNIVAESNGTNNTMSTAITITEP
jgi:subtilase family serine protease